jgi:putative transposase
MPGMARKPRLEVEGGLYHVITRGVDRRDIFHCPEDHQKFLSLLAIQKAKLPFYLYAYCLMTNHIHLLIERRVDDIGRIMHRVLTGYTQYYNRRYGRVGHVLQGRHRAILCQSERYLTELVRYIHLNPVRAGMVDVPEEYPFSSHRAYLGLEPDGVTDVDPVLRGFGARKSRARELFAQFVMAGAKMGRQERFYEAENGVLGSDEFVDAMIHPIGQHDAAAALVRRYIAREVKKFRADDLLRAVEDVCGIGRDEFVGPGKGARQMFAKNALIVSGRPLGATATELSRLVRISVASVSRRYDTARRTIQNDTVLGSVRDQIIAIYGRDRRES